MNKLVEGIDYRIEGKVLYINEGIEEIPEKAFEEDRRFMTLVCPNSLKYIGNLAFYNCYIENLILNDGLEYIDVQAFSNNNINKLVMPDSIYFVGNAAFSDNKNLSKVILSNSLGIIQMHTFCGCTSLKDINIPESVKVIEKYAFFASGIDDFVIPNSVVYTTDVSFKGDSECFTCYRDFSNVIASDIENKTCAYGSIQKVMKKNDYYIDSSKKLIIKEGVQIIPTYAFKDMDISGIVFPSTLKVISNSAFNNCNIYNVKFPDSLIYIGERAFADCRNLIRIELNEGLLAIDKGAFSGHHADSIDLPESLVYLERGSFKANTSYTGKSYNKSVNINPKNIKFIDFTDNNLSNVVVMDYPINSYIAYSEYSNRKRKINDYLLFNENSTSNIISTIVDNNVKKIADVSEIESQTIGKIIQTQIDNYLLYKDKYISIQSLTNVVEGLILLGGNINTINQNNTPLIMLVYSNNLTDLFQLLLKYGAYINTCDMNGLSLLMHSIIKNDANMFSTLIKLGCDVNIKDNEGNTALIYAIKSKNIEFVKSLISNNAYINTVNSSNKSVLEIAEETGVKEIISLFKNEEELLDDDVSEATKDLEFIKQLVSKNVHV